MGALVWARAEWQPRNKAVKQASKLVFMATPVFGLVSLENLLAEKKIPFSGSPGIPLAYEGRVRASTGEADAQLSDLD
jgi:hypothetical protein